MARKIAITDFIAKWPTKAKIIEKRGDSFLHKEGVARRTFENENVETYELKIGNLVHTTKPFEYDCVNMTEKGKSVINVYTPNGVDYFPVYMKNLTKDENGNEIKLTVRNVDNEKFRAMKAREIILKTSKESNFMKALPIIIVVATFAISYLIITDSLAQLNTQTGIVNAGINRIGQSLDRSTEVLEKVYNIQPKGSVTNLPPA